MDKKIYKDKLFSVLGDSISTLEGYNPPDYAVFYDREHKYLSGVFAPSDTWWGQVIEHLDGRLLVNGSYSGSLVSKHPDCEIESYGASDARTGSLGIGEQSPDVVMVLLGLNDLGCGIPIVNESENDRYNSFLTAYMTMLEKLKNNYPSAEIWCLTLPKSTWSAEPNYVRPSCRGGATLEDYCRTIRECAATSGCRLLDIYDPDRPYDTIDGYHPNASGMRSIATAVISQLQCALK